MIFVLAGGVLSGCGQTDSVDVAADVEVNTEVETKEVWKDKLFKDYPSVELEAHKDDYVLAPSKSFLEEAYKNGVENASGTYYAQKVDSVGEHESSLIDSFDTVSEYPNNLIIPIPSGNEAVNKDVLFTTWQSGSGAIRALVVSEEVSIEPEVYYLDLDYGTLDSAKESDILALDTFYKLTPDTGLQVGKTSACYVDGSWNKGMITNIAGDKLLTTEWAGTLNSYDVDDCIALDPYTTFNVDDSVIFAPFGTFDTTGTITKIDESIGRAWISYEFAGEETEEIVPTIDLLKELPIK